MIIKELNKEIDYDNFIETDDINKLKELANEGNADAICKIGIMWYEGGFEKVDNFKRNRKIQINTAEKLFLSIPENGEANYYLYLIYSFSEKEDILMKSSYIEQQKILNKIWNEGGKKIKYLHKAVLLNNILAKIELAKAYINSFLVFSLNIEKAKELLDTCKEKEKEFYYYLYEINIKNPSEPEKDIEAYEYLKKGKDKNDFISILRYIQHPLTKGEEKHLLHKKLIDDIKNELPINIIKLKGINYNHAMSNFRIWVIKDFLILYNNCFSNQEKEHLQDLCYKNILDIEEKKKYASQIYHGVGTFMSIKNFKYNIIKKWKYRAEGEEEFFWCPYCKNKDEI